MMRDRKVDYGDGDKDLETEERQDALTESKGRHALLCLVGRRGRGDFVRIFLYLKLTCPSEPVGEGKELLNLVVGLGGEN